MKCIHILLAILTIGVSPITRADTGNVARAEAHALLETLSRHFSGIQTLSYTAERTTEGRRQNSRERWLFAYQAPGNIRVDYQYPVERHLLLTSNSLVEYIPALRRAIRTDLQRMPETTRQSTIKQTLARISLDGINPSNFQEMAARATSITHPTPASDSCRISGTGPKFLLEIDRRKNVLLATDIFTPDDTLLLHTEASRFIEANPGFWYPQHVVARYWTEQGFVTTTTLIRNVTLNTPFPKDTFEFTVPEHVTLETR